MSYRQSRKPRFDEVLYEEPEGQIIMPTEGRGYLRVSYESGRLWTTYMGIQINGKTKAELRTQIEQMDEEARLKREHERAKAAARSNPVEAMDRQFRPIKVRGVHQTTGQLLIVTSDGSKGSWPRGSVFRVLTEEEQHRLNALRAEAERFKADIPETTTYEEVVKALALGNPTARYNEDRDTQVLTLPDGTEVDTHDPDKAFKAWLRFKVAETHPVFRGRETLKPVAAGEDAPYSDTVSSYDYVFRSTEEGEAYLRADQAADQAWVAANKAEEEYLFDASGLEA